MSASTPSDSPLLAARGVHKRFGATHALKGVDFNVRGGEVHAVVGENGAGKSTLMHILAGVHRPDSCQLEWSGRGIRFDNERAARNAGIALVHQERSLFTPLSVAENIFAGRLPCTEWGAIDRKSLRSRSEHWLREIGLHVHPDTPVEFLSSAQQQLIEIAKALSQDARLIIFDEPTTALSGAETETLFGIMDRLRDRGVGIVYITHRLHEVFRIADRVTVLKDGESQGTHPIADVTPSGLVTQMVGRELDPHCRRTQAPSPGDVVLQVHGLSDKTDDVVLKPRLQNISFQVRAGEIVALAGLVGAGRTEVALALIGCRPSAIGDIRLRGQPLHRGSPAEALAAGIGYLSEDRKETGVFPEMSIADNASAIAADRFGRWRFDAVGRDRAVAEHCQRLRVVCRGVREPIRNLSGGNQQKVLLCRWLIANPQVLIVDEPTRGVDVVAKVEIHGLLFGLAEKGTAVIVISSDLPEVLAVADRILVLREGRLAGELAGSTATEQDVMQLATLG